MSSLEEEFLNMYKKIDDFRLSARSESACIDNFADYEIKLNNETICFIERQLSLGNIEEHIASVCIEEIKGDNAQFEIIKATLLAIKEKRIKAGGTISFTPMYSISASRVFPENSESPVSGGVRSLSLRSGNIIFTPRVPDENIEPPIQSGARSLAIRICNFFKR